MTCGSSYKLSGLPFLLRTNCRSRQWEKWTKADSPPTQIAPLRTHECTVCKSAPLKENYWLTIFAIASNFFSSMGRSPGPLPFTRFPHTTQQSQASNGSIAEKGPPATAAACPVQLNPPVSRYSLEERLPVSRVVFHAVHCVVDVRFYRMDRLRLLPHQAQWALPPYR